MDPSSKVAIKSFKMISIDVFNIDQDLSDNTEQNQCVSSIQGNSRIISYSLILNCNDIFKQDKLINSFFDDK